MISKLNLCQIVSNNFFPEINCTFHNISKRKQNIVFLLQRNKQGILKHRFISRISSLETRNINISRIPIILWSLKGTFLSTELLKGELMQ